MSDDSPDSTSGTCFREKVKPSVTLKCELERSSVCWYRYLDETDMSLNVAQVTSMFGSFVKYTVRTVQNSTSPTIQVPRLNTFELVFQSQRRLAMQTLPSHKDNPKNWKQKLRNDVLDLFDQNSMVFKHSEVTSVEEQVVQVLTNTLWYVDGHHEVLKSLFPRSNFYFLVSYL